MFSDRSCEPDVPWVADVFRYKPDDRMAFHQHCLRLLESNQRNVITFNGSWKQRTSSAIAAVDAGKSATLWCNGALWECRDAVEDDASRRPGHGALR